MVYGGRGAARLWHLSGCMACSSMKDRLAAALAAESAKASANKRQWRHRYGSIEKTAASVAAAAAAMAANGGGNRHGGESKSIIWRRQAKKRHGSTVSASAMKMAKTGGMKQLSAQQSAAWQRGRINKAARRRRQPIMAAIVSNDAIRRNSARAGIALIMAESESQPAMRSSSKISASRKTNSISAWLIGRQRRSAAANAAIERRNRKMK